MTRASIFARRIAVVVAWLAVLGGCARPPETGKTTLTPATFGALQEYLLAHKADLDLYRLRGPYALTVKDDYEIRLSTTELVKTDLYLSAHGQKAPLVVILHGHDSTKEAHAFQATHLATWGMHSLVLQLPNTGPWIANGKTVAKIVNFVQRWPEIIDNRIDVNKIILVGHSFGGAAVTVALAEGAAATGGILLDPAAAEIDLPKYFRKVHSPVLVLGADEYVSAARNRNYYYRFIPAGIAEISIKDASHDDALYRADAGLATEELQITFVSALTSAAFSLAIAGNFDYAWASFSDGSGRSRFFNAKKK